MKQNKCVYKERYMRVQSYKEIVTFSKLTKAYRSHFADAFNKLCISFIFED